MGVKNVCTKLPKGTPLRQIWSNKSFSVCGSDVVLTLYRDEKKSTRESPLENRVYRGVVMGDQQFGVLPINFCLTLLIGQAYRRDR